MPGVVKAVAAPPEVVLRVAVRDPHQAVVERFTKEFAPLVTSGPPGVTGYTTGRPAVRSRCPKAPMHNILKADRLIYGQSRCIICVMQSI